MTSLLTFQILNPNISDEYLNAIKSSGIKRLKVINPEGRSSWGIPIIARYWFPKEADKQLVWQGRAGARVWFSWVKPLIDRCPEVEYVQIINEWNPMNISEVYVLGEYTDEAAILLHSIGKKAMGGGFGSTHPCWDGAGTYMATLTQNLDALEVHEYKMNYNLQLTMAQEFDVSRRWWLGRFLRTLRDMKAGGVRIPPIFFGEFGVDANGGQDSDGWRNFLSAQQVIDLGKEYEVYVKAGCAEYGAECLGIAYFASNPHPGQWSSFNMDGEANNILIDYLKQGGSTVAVPIAIDGRLMSAPEFSAYAPNSGAKNWATRVCIHHTYIPNLAQWADVGWEGRKYNMAYYYGVTRGWDAGPHLFVSPEGIGLFSPLNKPGIGAKGLDPEGGYWNDNTIHIEVVGNYSSLPPTGVVYDNAVAAAAYCLQAIGKSVERLTYHKILQPDTECPGNGFVNMWTKFREDVNALQNPIDLSEELPTATKVRWHTEEAYRELEAAGVPLNSPGMLRLFELIRLDGGLMYRFEELHKEA